MSTQTHSIKARSDGRIAVGCPAKRPKKEPAAGFFACAAGAVCVFPPQTDFLSGLFVPIRIWRSPEHMVYNGKKAPAMVLANLYLAAARAAGKP